MVADTKDNLSAILSSSPSSALPTKRRLESETDSDFDDEQGCRDALVGSPLSNSASDDSGCYTMARKKRRGLIEKRRRDRINKSLNDLKNMIPTATERQASTKLEKSEVLSLAVDHIKSLTIQAEAANPQTLAQDYRSIGYRECLHELVGYLTHGEGLGPASPLHTRIIGHLHQQLAHTERKPVLQPPHFPSAYPTQVLSRLGVPQTLDCGPYDQAIQCKPEPASSPSYQDYGYQFASPDYGLTNGELHHQQQWPQTSPPVPIISENSGQYSFAPPSPWV